MLLTQRFRLADAWLAGMSPANAINYAFADGYPTQEQVKQACDLYTDLESKFHVATQGIKETRI